MMAAAEDGEDWATEVASCASGFRLLPQYPQYFASGRTGRRQLGQIVAIGFIPLHNGVRYLA